MKKGFAVLVADDDKRHREILAALLKEWQYTPITAKNGMEAVELAARADLVLLDARMPVMGGFEAFAKIHAARPELPVVIMTAYSEVEDAVSAIRDGAWDYLTKPLDFEKLRITLRNAAEKLGLVRENAELAAAQSGPLLGRSQAMLNLVEMISVLAPTEATVLIEGESGTGKELAARAIHQASGRANGPFVAVNCGALTETLLASELFGHEKGAFTGADKKHEGLFSQASGGTIFLDEIGEMPTAMQVKLLRALQERAVIPVGGARPVSIDCRVVAATNRDLASEVAKGNFREDLYYRLNVMSLKMPPLRDRKDDIPLLSSHFARKFAAENKRVFSGIAADAMERLTAWDWPGNVRELANVMERAIILMPGESIQARVLPEKMQLAQAPRQTQEGDDFEFSKIVAPTENWPTLDEIEKRVILETLKRLGNNKTEAAKALGITRKTLHTRLREYGSSDN